jgi:ectoine hydroxylase-related dioxygenase (phytanoyl-CoA dioxygenase family)
MNNIREHRNQFTEQGYAVIPNIFSVTETANIKQVIEQSDKSNETFRKSADLFAIRQFLKELPDAVSHILNASLINTIREIFGQDYFITKSIYFDKPGASNWYVAYHQDLTISVDNKIETEGFGPWTTKQNQFAVQPPLVFLENNFTIRIHLDETNEDNGALKVIPGSHKKGIWRADKINFSLEEERICAVPSGGIMLMHPLLMHASGRTINNKQRRVIHIEFSNKELPENLNWSEKIILN